MDAKNTDNQTREDTGKALGAVTNLTQTSAVPSSENELDAKIVQSSRAVVDFLKTPANIMAILAIIATVIVPAVDKYLKRDEELRVKTAELLDTTDKVINIRNDIEQLPM